MRDFPALFDRRLNWDGQLTLLNICRESIQQRRGRRKQAARLENDVESAAPGGWVGGWRREWSGSTSVPVCQQQRQCWLQTAAAEPRQVQLLSDLQGRWGGGGAAAAGTSPS